jgi:HAE1 family hydrophobic/amphiphilic exporter-1
MKLIDTSVNRPVGVTIIVIAIMILGAVSLNGLAIDLLPNLEFPVAAVMTSYDGAAPEEIEKLVTKPLEGTIGTIEGLETIQSTSAPNQSVLLLLFKYGTDLDQATLDLRDKIDMASMMLPEDADKPTILKADVNAMPIMQLSLSGDIDQTRLTQIAEDTLQPRLERIPGVAQVSITGGKTREISVEADPDKLNAYGTRYGATYIR